MEKLTNPAGSIDSSKGGLMEKNRQKKKKSAGDVLLTIVLILAIGVFCFAAYNLYHIFTEYKKGTDEYNQIAQMAVTTRHPQQLSETEEELVEMEPLRAPLEVDFAALKAVNDDVVGWIYIEALPDVNYPVVQGEDNSAYLHMTYEKNYNFAGTIFVDYENKGDFTDCNTIVYGHNMKNGSMFGSLSKFVKDPELYQKSRYFWILTPEHHYRYEILAAYTTAVDSDTYTLFKGPGAEFEEYLQRMKDNSEIKTQVRELTMMDRIVTLSTCTGNEATRFVVQGVCVDVLQAG